MPPPLRVAQVGTRGFGRIHLERIERLRAGGRVDLVAVADPAGPTDLDCPWYPSLTGLLAEIEADIVSIATPIGTHVALASEAMEAGAHVFLEKPPVPSLSDFHALRALQDRWQRAVQVGFQSLGSAGIERLHSIVAGDSLGVGPRIAARGVWIRSKGYYARSSWAGRRMMQGRRVADGVVTNPLAHAVATALTVAGVRALDDIVAVDTELYHAHAIEADDTSFVRVHRATGSPVVAALTLCGGDQGPPTIEIIGQRGRASYAYTEDVLTVETGRQRTTERFGRVCLLENLVDHVENGADLLVPLAETVGFTCVLEATQDRPDPFAIDEQFVDWRAEGAEAHPVLQDVERWIDEAVDRGESYDEVGAPWADPAASVTWRPAR